MSTRIAGAAALEGRTSSVSGTIDARDAVIKGKVPVQEEASLVAQKVNNLLLYRRPRSTPGSRISPEEGNGSTLQDS